MKIDIYELAIILNKTKYKFTLGLLSRIFKGDRVRGEWYNFLLISSVSNFGLKNDNNSWAGIEFDDLRKMNHIEDISEGRLRNIIKIIYSGKYDDDYHHI